MSDPKYVHDPENFYSDQWDHPSIKDALNNMDTGAATTTAQAWTRFATDATTAIEDFAKAVASAIEENWQGVAADAAKSTVTEYGKTAPNALAEISGVAQSLYPLIDAASSLQSRIGDPVSRSFWDKATPWDTDREDERYAAEAEARAAMQTVYTPAVGETDSQVPSFTPPESPGTTPPQRPHGPFSPETGGGPRIGDPIVPGSGEGRTHPIGVDGTAPTGGPGAPGSPADGSTFDAPAVPTPGGGDTPPPTTTAAGYTGDGPATIPTTPGTADAQGTGQRSGIGGGVPGAGTALGGIADGGRSTGGRGGLAGGGAVGRSGGSLAGGGGSAGGRGAGSLGSSGSGAGSLGSGGGRLGAGGAGAGPMTGAGVGGGSAGAGGAAGTAGAASRGATGAPPMGGMAGGGGAGSNDEKEHKTPDYLVSLDNGSELIGRLPLAAPPVIGA